MVRDLQLGVQRVAIIGPRIRLALLKNEVVIKIEKGKNPRWLAVGANLEWTFTGRHTEAFDFLTLAVVQSDDHNAVGIAARRFYGASK